MQNNLPTISVRKLVRIKSKAGQSAQLREALITLEKATCKEPGCVEFSFFQAIADDHSFVLLEQFADQAAFDVHMQLEHTRAFFGQQLVSSVEAIDFPNLG